jgi:putative DNA primase/helicase
MGIALQHLSEQDRISIARELFTVTDVDSSRGELLGLCPIHQESNPSFAYNYKKDTYNCLSCGAGGDLLRLWSEINGFGQKVGFKAFCEKFAISPGERQKRRGAAAQEGGAGGAEPVSHETAIEQMRVAWERFAPLPEIWLERLERERGWSRKWMEIMDLRLQTCYLNKKGGLSEIQLP